MNVAILFQTPLNILKLKGFGLIGMTLWGPILQNLFKLRTSGKNSVKN